MSNGLRDAVERASSFIESAHRVLSIWALTSANNGKVLYGDYQREMEGAFIDSLPDKLAHLKTEHGMAVDSVLERQLLSINNARNCLVHRRGIISQRDLNSDDTMRVEWRKLHIFLQNQDGEHDLVIGQIARRRVPFVCVLRTSRSVPSRGARHVHCTRVC
jgi:hypothetical protein